MRTSELDYHLPPGLIAQQPAVPRDSSRLLIYNRSTSRITHGRLPDLLSALNPGDVLIYNDSRVIRARLHAHKPTGGRVELLFLRRRAEKLWEALVKPSARLKEGMELGAASAGTSGSASGTPAKPWLRLEKSLGSGRWLVRNICGVSTEELLEASGEMPLPPYIREELRDPGRYQTVFAARSGSAAAPTAGLHFTPELIHRIQESGAGMFPVTLHIGLDTFRPVSEEDLSLHRIHCEHYEMPPETCEAVLKTRQRGGKVIAVGTTSVRVLETVFRKPAGEDGPQLEGETDLFITPGFQFRSVDALLTNFHLPRSTLLAMVMAFTGKDETRRIYREAIREGYRFYSFGDAMLVL